MNISVIIPVYNVEKYLARCLDSVINQTMKSIEIILVNDGSKDSSLEICNEYKKRDSRIKVIDKVNEGVSIARNRGIEAAKGDFIGFVDPDDWIESDMYESMYNKIIQTNCDVCFCNYYKDNKISSSPKLLPFKEDILEKKDIIEDLIGNMIGIESIFPKYTYIMGCVWRCLYKREFINENKLRFKPKITIMEDLIFTVEAMIKCNRVCIDQGIRYHYMQNWESVLHSYNRTMWRDQVIVHNTLESLLTDVGLEDYMRNRLDIRYISMAIASVQNELRGGSANKDRKEILKEINNDIKLKKAIERSKKASFTNLKSFISKEELALLIKSLYEGREES